MRKTLIRKTCRVCGTKTDPLFSLGNVRMNAFPKPGEKKPPKVPLTLDACPGCDLLQLRHTAPFNDMYVDQYWYKSGVNPVISRDLKEIVTVTKKAVGKTRKGTWIDIGANDGTLLSYVTKGWKRIGVEPAKNLTDELARNCDVPIVKFWEDVKTEQADVITAIGMLYDTDDPNAFVRNMKAHLKPGGVCVAQLMTLRQMLENADVGNICHEHLLFPTYKSLVRLFEGNGLEIFRVEENGINGGSYRLFARHLNKGSIARPEPKPDYAKFTTAINDNRCRAVDFVRKAKKAGKRVYWYGASTKSNVILQWYGLTKKDIVAAADINPTKFGRTMVNGIPIVNERDAKKDADVFVVGPYGFRNLFLRQLETWRKKGGTVVFTTPKFEIL